MGKIRNSNPPLPRKSNKSLPRLAIVAPHVVQYHAPLYRKIAATRRVELMVLYQARYGIEPYYDATSDTVIQWDVPLLEGYSYQFMPNLSRARSYPLLGRVNPDIVWRLKRGRYDVLLLQDYFYLTSWLALLAAKMLRTKVIFRSEGTAKTDGHSHNSVPARAIARAFIKAADMVLYSCSGNRLWFEDLGAFPDEMALIPCSVDNDFFRTQNDIILQNDESPKKQLGLDDGVLYVITVARMFPRKRLLDLVEAVGILQSQGNRVGLMLIGDGPQRQAIETRVKELGLKHVHMPGFVNASEISAYYAAADVFVLTSEYDPSPKALSEALIFSLPVVCTEIVGTASDLALEGENGFVTPVGDVQALASCMHQILTGPELRRSMGRKSRRLSDQWSMEASASSVVKAVYRVMGVPGKEAEK